MNTQKYKDMDAFFHQIYLTCETFLRILEDRIQWGHNFNMILK